MIYKKCCICLKEKLTTDFGLRKNRKYSLNSQCKQCINLKSKKYREENREKVLETQKESYKRNKKNRLEKNKEYKNKNKDKIKIDNNNYCKKRRKEDIQFKKMENIRAKNRINLKRAIKYYNEGKNENLPSKSPSRLLLKLYEIQNNICAYCNNDMTDNIHIDHIIPLSKNGSNEVDNLILCCSTCNLSKNNKDLDVWLNECNMDYNSFKNMIYHRNYIILTN